MNAARILLVIVTALLAAPAHAVTIDWVTVGDPGNSGQTLVYSGTSMTFGAVNEAFQIMKFEWTNAQYVEFLNAVDPQGTNPNLIYTSSMSSDARGGITNTGSTDGSRYATKDNMADKPVNFVSWWRAARVANWLHNGAQAYGTSDASSGAPQNTGAYTVGTLTSAISIVPARNPGAQFFLPTENQWYKAAYYKGSGTNAGYWGYATQSNTAPTAATADSTGIGSAGSAGNFANYALAADWGGQNGNVTTVGTNGGPGSYGTFDMSGNVWEWYDLTGNGDTDRWGWIRGGCFDSSASQLSPSVRLTGVAAVGNPDMGFRLARPAPVPEPSTWAMGLAGLACGSCQMWRRRKRATEKGRRRRPVKR
jgi:sulfatase modifying factor 1